MKKRISNPHLLLVSFANDKGYMADIITTSGLTTGPSVSNSTANPSDPVMSPSRAFGSEAPNASASTTIWE